ncbi:hypothetical protein N0K08_17365 [Acidovorax sp. Be4]|uniref:Uncharacterized protein n=1 Tax=Acidovorax bellezanensis TaxID=2976702 RepID=A0ABT2PPM4_9BURK|nr:hypothetical protein [Acidovorax sp. Be4]MCT9812415.1 hypothetical protein [Acidovorax sp. Be4]
MAPNEPDFFFRGLAKLLSYVDGNWVDICSILTALAYVGWQWQKRPKVGRGPFICRDIGIEFVNAASIFPLVLLTLSFVSSKFTEALLSGNKIILSIAGGFALFALLEDRKSPSVVLQALDFVGPPQMPAANAPFVEPKVAPIRNGAQQVTRKRGKKR